MNYYQTTKVFCYKIQIHYSFLSLLQVSVEDIRIMSVTWRCVLICQSHNFSAVTCELQ
jgi:hypothetical protein